MNRYNASTGAYERIPDIETELNRSPLPFGSFGSSENSSQPFGAETGGGLGGLLSKLNLSSIELDDILLAAAFYLFYRESGDAEFLLMAGALLFL